MSEGRYDYRVVDSGGNGEFLTWATLQLLDGDYVVATEEYHGSSEFPGEDALTQALSSGRAWVEAMSHSLEERFGLEWERELTER